MSGIAGIFHRNGRPAEPSQIRLMLDALAHRGADAMGVHCAGPAGFGQRFHHTLPEPIPAVVPIRDDATGLVIVADARIDNRPELIAACSIDLQRSKEIHDFELILAAYKKWGEACPSHLIGDFSFAIWDGRNGQLFAARDHFGVKQFVYHVSPEGFFFASEIKALLQIQQVPRRLNEARIADYFVPLFGDVTSTLYEGIVHLPPAHSLTVSVSRCTTHRYWALEDDVAETSSSPRDWPAMFRETFLEAVRCRLRGASVGVLVSGGLDSSSVLCSAAALLGDAAPDKLRMFSGMYDHAVKSDERMYGNIVAQHCGITPLCGYPEQFSPLTDWDASIPFEDEPLRNPQMPLRWSLYHVAQGENVGIMLDGYGGDGVVSNGMALLPELLRRGKWIRMLREAARVARRHHRPTPHLIRKYGLKPLAPHALHVLWERMRNKTWRGISRVPLNTDFARRVDATGRAALFGDPLQIRTATEAHLRSVQSGLYPSAFACFDQVSARFGIEPRHPYFDRRVVRLCLTIPPEEKLTDGWTRSFARRAMAGIVPDAIRWRGDKGDLSHGFHFAFQHGDTEILDAICYQNYGGIQDFVDMSSLRGALRRYRAIPSNDDGIALWCVVLIARWLQRTGLR